MGVRDEFFGRPWVGVLGVASDDGRPPLTVPVFYAYVDGLVTFFTGTQGRKARKTRLIARAKQVSLCVQQTEGALRTVTAECAVVRTDRAPSVDQVVAIAGRYMPATDARAFAAAELDAPTGTFVLFTARPERWLEMGL
ncbi:pyridoxamine 5'-phosphate oxidase family protein [Actinosynnema sp. NPDC047251]|uniref:pyridoxamine 5'-phosphate oxidase family protein n=1 Tax=Saccharothrix espanaensis TaxID=103731 RepID=UPI0011DE50A8|nr:pyridoxamine 5'-phosphate oxidase family protein [Saccharothrix espanaensis]